MGVEEHSLPTERQPFAFQMDGIVHRVVSKAMDNLLDRIQILWNRRHTSDRGPDPDYSEPLEQLEDIRAAIREELSGYEPNIRIERYHESGGGDGDRVPKWLMPGLVTLTVAGIIGQVVQYAQNAAMRQELTDLRAEVNDLKKLVEPRYRGAP